MKDAELAWGLLNRQDKRRFWALLALMLVNGSLEICGIGLIFPYIGIIGDPELIHRNVWLEKFYQLARLTTFNQLVVLLSALLLGVFIFKNCYGLFLQRRLLRFAMLKQLDLGKMQMVTCVLRPYEYFLSHNSSAIVRNLTSSIPNVCNGVIVPWLNLLTDMFMVIGVLALIIFVQPLAALIAIGVAGPLSWLLFSACKNRILKYGTEQNSEYRAVVKHSTETLQGIKEIKASGRGGYFVDRYVESASRYLRALQHYSFLVVVPRSSLEVIMVGTVTLVVLIMLFFSKTPIQQVVPLLAVYATAAVRVMPSFNRIIMSMNGIRFYRASTQEVMSEYREGQVLTAEQPSRSPVDASAWQFRQSVELREVDFQYSGSREAIFNRLSLRIKRGESVAFIGRSGSGKSTLVDLILGLLEPAAGVIAVDGRDIRTDLEAWQQQVGYIPQQIYLMDDTLKRNVALGVADAAVDLEQLDRVLKMADLQEFVSGLPRGTETMLGEHGVMLSGGQRQRIGIARALYRQPSLLIMDEATSALDNISERKVIEAISTLSGSVTVIMVAHRLSTVKYCNQIYLLEKGRIVDFGDYAHIEERHPYFINPAGEANKPMPSDVQLLGRSR